MLVLEWKEITFIEKVNSRCFCWFPAAILVYQNGALIWRLYTKLYKGAWNVSANNSETVGHKDLKRGQVVYILVFYNISFSWLLPLDGFQFNFLLRDSENSLRKRSIIWEHFKVVLKYMSTLTTLLWKPSFDSHVFQDLLFSYKKKDLYPFFTYWIIALTLLHQYFLKFIIGFLLNDLGKKEHEF